MTLSRYHSGELAVQTRAGVEVEASRLVKMIGSGIQPVVQDFLSSQQMAIASTVGNEQVWASLLTGDKRFVQAIFEQMVLSFVVCHLLFVRVSFVRVSFVYNS